MARNIQKKVTEKEPKKASVAVAPKKLGRKPSVAKTAVIANKEVIKPETKTKRSVGRPKKSPEATKTSIEPKVVKKTVKKEVKKIVKKEVKATAKPATKRVAKLSVVKTTSVKKEIAKKEDLPTLTASPVAEIIVPVAVTTAVATESAGASFMDELKDLEKPVQGVELSAPTTVQLAETASAPAKSTFEMKIESKLSSQPVPSSIPTPVNPAGIEIGPEADKEKKILMWTGVIFFMVLILSIWSYNFKAIFNVDRVMDTSGSQSRQEIKESVADNMKKVRQDLEEVKQVREQAKEQVRNDLFVSPGQAAGEANTTASSATTDVDLATTSIVQE